MAQGQDESGGGNRLEELELEARRALKAWAADEAGRPEAEGAAEAERRVVAIDLGGGETRVTVASDGLELGRKLAIEKRLKAALTPILESSGKAPGLSIYFKRLHGRAPAPAPVSTGGRGAATKSPFGVEFDRRAIPGVAEVIVVASGKGGVGKSTVSANLAVALAASGRRVGLLDADIHGPSAPTMLGLSGMPPAVSGEQLAPLSAHGVKVASLGFLADPKAPAIWRGPLVAKALRQLCYDVSWGDLDVLVVDLPPGTGDVQLTLAESIPLAGAVVVTTPSDVALIDAHKAISMFEKLNVPILGLVANMAYHRCSCCGHEDPVFGEDGAERMAAERGYPIVARLPLAASVRAGGDVGKPVALAVDSEPGQVFASLAAQLGQTLRLPIRQL